MKYTHRISIRIISIACLVIIIYIPLYYVIMEQIMYQNLDKSLYDQKSWIMKEISTTDVEHFVSFNENIIILPTPKTHSIDSIYNETVYQPLEAKMVEQRTLEFTAMAHEQNYVVRIQRSMSETKKILKNIIAVQAIISLLLVISLFLIDFTLSKIMWRPFYNILSNIKAYQIDKQETPDFSSTNILEFMELKNSLKELISKNRELYIAQKEFAENASHELQTPMAILQSNIDNLWQTSPISEEQAHIISNMQETTIRVSRINKALILLTKINNNQFQHKEKINVSHNTDNILTQYQDIIKHKQMRCSIKAEHSIEIYANPSLINILLNNVIGNAIQHSPNGGEIEVSTNTNAIIISNNAINGKLNRQKLFIRFQKQTHNTEKGIGLGLEICKRICDLYSFSIEYSFKNQRHYFTIYFS